MRLTLRTMLAYLDDVLDPDDAAELGSKIEESEFATGLVQRTRSSMTRPHLEAPPVEGEGMGHDPNTVAEYLDNTLPAERMPDFERVCLESDSHLAEAAACHQILTLVLGEPANVPSETRQRVYRIGAPSQAPDSPPDEAPPAATADSAGARTSDEWVRRKDSAPMPAEKTARKKPEVPDYLKTRSRLRFWPLAIALLLTLGIVGAVITVMNRSGATSIVASFISGEQEAEPDDSSSGTVTQPEDDPEDIRKDGNTGTDDLPEGSEEPGEPDTGEQEGNPDEGTPLVGGELPEAPLPPVVDVEEPGADVPPGDALPEEDDIRVASNNGGAVGDVPAEDPEPAPAATAELGRYTSDRQVLLRYVENDDLWMRLAPRSLLAEGDRWIVLPTYRPQITLATGVQLTFDGPAQVRVLPRGADGTPYLAIDYGKAIIVNFGRANARLGLRLGDREGELVFVDADSTCAVEVERIHPAGLDPEATTARIESRLYCTSGSVTWIDSQQPLDSDPQVVMAGRVREMIDSSPAGMSDYSEMPAWIAGNHLTDIDRMGSTDLEPFLEEERSVGLSLREKSTFRRAEVKSLASRSLCYLDEFDAAIAALGDSSQRAHWSAHIDALRDGLARGPQTAGDLRATLERKRGQNAAALYRMLWGYRQADLEGDDSAARTLVETLKHEDLDMRVAAFENLRRITGVSLLYFPEAPESSRRRALRQWEDRLRDENIVFSDAAADADSRSPESQDPAEEPPPIVPDAPVQPAP